MPNKRTGRTFETDTAQCPTPRSHPRISTAVEVMLRIPGSPGEEDLDVVASSESLDLSQDGLQVGVDQPIRLETLLRMNVTVPTFGQTFKLVGRVAGVT